MNQRSHTSTVDHTSALHHLSGMTASKCAGMYTNTTSQTKLLACLARPTTAGLGRRLRPLVSLIRCVTRQHMSEERNATLPLPLCSSSARTYPALQSSNQQTGMHVRTLQQIIHWQFPPTPDKKHQLTAWPASNCWGTQELILSSSDTSKASHYRTKKTLGGECQASLWSTKYIVYIQWDERVSHWHVT